MSCQPAEWSPCAVDCAEGMVCDPAAGACVRSVSTIDPQGPGGGAGGNPAVGGGAGSGGGGGGGGAAGGPPAGDLPCDVATVVGSSCVSCHGANPSGGASFALVTRADFTAISNLDPTKTVGQRSVIRMRASVAEMPPATNARVQPFDINVVDSWVNSGMPSGTCAPIQGAGGGAGGAGGGSSVGGGAGGSSGVGGGTSGVGGGGGTASGGGAGGGGTASGGGAGGGGALPANYCKTCTASSQCGSTKNFCLGSGTTGACGTDCSAGQVCPSSAHCVQIVNGSQTVVGSNCVPTSGVCGGAGGGGGSTGTGGGGGGSTGTGGGGGGATCTDTWAGYAKTAFSSNCAGCHSTEFSTVSAVSSNKTNIRSRIYSGNMPPGGLSSSSTARLVSWMDCGLKP